jgi:hypothetical protein
MKAHKSFFFLFFFPTLLVGTVLGILLSSDAFAQQQQETCTDNRTLTERVQDLLSTNIPGFPDRGFNNGGSVTCRYQVRPNVPPTPQQVDQKQKEERDVWKEDEEERDIHKRG